MRSDEVILLKKPDLPSMVEYPDVKINNGADRDEKSLNIKGGS